MQIKIMNIKIRKANESDLAAILSLFAQPEMDNGSILSLDKAKALFKKIQSYPCYTIFVATIDEKIIGTFALLIMDNLAHMGTPSGIVEDIVVDPAYQGKGIGKLIMNYAIDQCKEAGCYKLALSSNLRRVQAHKFYKSLRFKQHGINFVIDIPK